MLAVLQFDSASVSLLERLLSEGRLPTLARLAERGRWRGLATPATHFAAGAFHTLYSGEELADHGLFYPFRWSAQEQRMRYMTAFERPPAVWERLAARDLRTLAIDPYEGHPPQADVGVCVSGWQFKDRVVLRRWSSPRGAHRRLSNLFGAPFAAEEVFGRPSVGELLRLRRRLIAAPARVADAALHLLARESFELVWLTFSAAHLAGHQFWDLSQVAHENPDEGARHLLRDALAEVYGAVDAAMSRVVAALPPDADVVVVSPVGMDVNLSRADLLPGMLEAILRGSGPRAEAPGYIWRLRAAVPAGLRSRVVAALPDALALELTARLELRGMDWSRTRAFAMPADNQGYVRLNLRGRERDGVVGPDDAEALMDEIAAGLETFHDPDGAPSVEAVERVSEAFGAGARADWLPDLIVRWSPATRLEGVSSPCFGEVRRSGNASGRSGNHTDGDGWALVVPGGSALREPSRPPRVVDVAATAAALARIPTADMAGEPLLEPA